MSSDFKFLRSDTPITGVSEDKLQRSDLANRLARRIARYQGPQALTVGICGPWGSGKTSFVNLVEGGLREAVRPEGEILGPVVLTPWTLATSDDLAGELLVEIGRALELKAGAQAVASNAAAIGSEIAILGAALLAAHQGANPGWMGYIVSAAAASELASKLKALASPITGRLNPKGGTTTVGERQARISKALSDSNSLLVVALDDLERLPSDRIQEVFRVVSAIASFSNTVYILSMDRHRAAHALNDVFGDGHAYLEKFLNLTFDLPKPEPSMIANLMIGELNAILARYDFSDKLAVSQIFGQVWHGGLKHFIQTPRDVVRILNSFDMALEAIADEVHPVDLLALETLRATEPRLHQRLAASRSALLRGRGDMRVLFAKEKVEQESQRQFAALLDEVAEPTRSHLKELLGVVFPLTQKGARVDDSSAHRQRRATSLGHFDHYFRWSLAGDALSELDLRKLVAELCAIRSDDAARAWAEANASRFQQFGEKLSHFMSDLGTTETRWDFAAGLLRVAHLLDDSLGLIRSNHMLAQSLAYQAIQADERAREAWPAEVWERCRETELLFGVARYYVMSLDEQPRTELDRTKPGPEVRSAIAERLAAVICSGSLDGWARLGTLLYRWRDIAGSAAGPRRYVSQLIETGRRQTVLHILDDLINVTSREAAPQVAEIHDETNLDQLTGLFNRDELATFVQTGGAPPNENLFAAVRRALSRWNERGDDPGELERQVLRFVVQQVVRNGAAVAGREARMILEPIDPKLVDRALDRLQPDRVHKFGMRPAETYLPTLEFLLAEHNRAREVLDSLLTYLRGQLRSSPLPSFDWKGGLRAQLGLEKEDRGLVLALVQVAYLGQHLTSSDDSFSFNPPDDPEEVVRCSSVDELVQRARAKRRL